MQTRANIAASFQHVAVGQLAHRVQRSLQWAREVEPLLTCLVVAGGVAANATVRSRLEEVASMTAVPVFFPPAKLCTDNGAPLLPLCFCSLSLACRGDTSSCLSRAAEEVRGNIQPVMACTVSVLCSSAPWILSAWPFWDSCGYNLW